MKEATVEFLRKTIVEDRIKRQGWLLDAVRHGFASMEKRIQEYQEITAVENDFDGWIDAQEEEDA